MKEHIMNLENCIFCKIAKGEIPSATIYEDEDFRVILDLMPASKGHALVLPKAHAADLYELEDGVAARVLLVAKKVMAQMTDILGCDGYNVLQNNGTCAGQTVFHYHMHLIPRYEGEDIGISWESGTLDEQTKEEILSKLRL